MQQKARRDREAREARRQRSERNLLLVEQRALAEQADAEEKQRVHQEGVLTPRTLALVQAEEERKKKREIGTSPHSTHATRTHTSPSRYACCM